MFRQNNQQLSFEMQEYMYINETMVGNKTTPKSSHYLHGKQSFIKANLMASKGSGRQSAGAGGFVCPFSTVSFSLLK